MRSVSARRVSVVCPLANTTAELQALRTVTTLKLQLSFTPSCFHTYPPPTPPPPRNTFFLILSLSLSPSDGSITGAMLRELLQPSLSGCVSSNVRVELSNLLTMQEKGKKENEEKKSLWSPNDARWEPSCAKFRRVFLPSFLSCGPRTPIYRHSHIGPLCMAEPKQLCSAEKK